MDKTRILIVEDDPIIAADLEDRLLEIGYSVIGPYDQGEEAFEVIKKEVPDLVIMDVQLAGKWDGIETVRQIDKVVQLPIIF
jgi:DNA-binding response OmpR family regulator